MREFRSYGSMRGALSNERPYRELIDRALGGIERHPLEDIEIAVPANVPGLRPPTAKSMLP
jgi:hypothetical protein